MFKQIDLIHLLTGRHRTLTLSVLCVAATVLTVWLLVNYHLPGKSQFQATLQDSGHALVFFCLSLVFAVLFGRLRPDGDKKTHAFTALLACILTGAVVEIIQSQVGRESSWSDLLLDTIGAAAGSAVFLSFHERRRLKITYLVLAFVLLAISLSSPVIWLYAGYQRDSAFPVIADFENTWLNKFIDARYSATYSIVPAPEAWKENTTRVAKVNFDTGPWPGLISRDVSGDWRKYRYFVFEVFNPQEQELKLVLRINDKHHNNLHADRFNRTYDIKPGHREIKVAMDDIMRGPSTREMDMEHVFGTMVYMLRPSQPYTLYFDNFRLE